MGKAKTDYFNRYFLIHFTKKNPQLKNCGFSIIYCVLNLLSPEFGFQIHLVFQDAFFVEIRRR